MPSSPLTMNISEIPLGLSSLLSQTDATALFVQLFLLIMEGLLKDRQEQGKLKPSKTLLRLLPISVSYSTVLMVWTTRPWENSSRDLRLQVLGAALMNLIGSTLKF